jgi:hypothetical protein
VNPSPALRLHERNSRAGSSQPRRQPHRDVHEAARKTHEAAGDVGAEMEFEGGHGLSSFVASHAFFHFSSNFSIVSIMSKAGCPWQLCNIPPISLLMSPGLVARSRQAALYDASS